VAGRRVGPARPATAAVLLLVLFACTPAPAVEPSSPPTASFTNRVWRVISPAGRAPGSFYIFLSDGTLVMTSCVETYRLATWRAATPGDAVPNRLTIVEDTNTTYGAEVRRADGQRLELRLHLKSEVVDLGLEPGTTPFVCPDLRPSSPIPPTED
jgi:hypothetical protein